MSARARRYRRRARVAVLAAIRRMRRDPRLRRGREWLEGVSSAASSALASGLATGERAWRHPATRRLRSVAPGVTCVVGAVAVVVLSSGIGVAAYLAPRMRALVEAPSHCPTTVLSAPVTLARESRLGADDLEEILTTVEYRRAVDGIEPGRYWREGERLSVGLLARHAPDRKRGRRLDVLLSEGRVQELWLDGEKLGEEPLSVGPFELAAVHDDTLVDCRPVSLDEVPAQMIAAVLAAEDDSFYRHGGVSPVGILRAAWVNLKQGSVVQGGSTLTQQLVKNLYLTPERTLSRKVREALLALALEWRYEKSKILEAYLNHAYWGRRGSRQLVGLGAASRAWFGKDPAELDVHEAALLAAMIRSPGAYDPVSNPEAARSRRDRILARMVSLGQLDAELGREAAQLQLGVRPEPRASALAPYFVDRVVREVESIQGTALAGAGYRLQTTLDLPTQLAAERAVREGLGDLAREDLQAALVALDSRTGEVRAWVGGRDYDASEFDRVGSARRQAGSTFKPFVFAAALQGGIIAPGDSIADAPVLVGYGSEYWLPRNYDRSFAGWVTVEQALAASRNVPTVRVALATGLEEVRDLAAGMELVAAGIEAVPSLALGTPEVSPLGLARAYAPFGNGGVLPPVRMVTAMRAPDGLHAPLPDGAPRRVLDADVAGRMSTMLRRAVRSGTGGALRRYGVAERVAGKTGTSDDRRDAWFAGFDAQLATVVWVGRDDDRPVRLTGAEGALPIWGRFMRAVSDERRSLPVYEPTPAGSPAVQRAAFTDQARSLVGNILRPRWRPDSSTFFAWDGFASFAHARRADSIVTTIDRDPWAEMIERLEDRAVALTGAVRIYEVGYGFRFPCLDDDRAAVEANPCKSPGETGGRPGG